MGTRNSSITRVWPLFDLLFARSPDGRDWLGRLISLAPNRDLAEAIGSKVDPIEPELAQFGRKIPGQLAAELRPDQFVALGNLRNAFEQTLPPAAEFLEWLICNPDQLSWPDERSQKWLKQREQTRRSRALLKAHDEETKAEALRLLQIAGAAKSSKQWWAFEGDTNVDCYIETSRLLLLIEGKRTEEVSSKTDWFGARDQIVRNLEAAAASALQSGKHFAMLVCAESAVELSRGAVDKSLPHLRTEQRDALLGHYLGCVTWEQMRAEFCPEVTLPDRIDDAVEFCLWARRQ